MNAQVVQTFIYQYISEKLKTEKFAMQVDARFEKFLASLQPPLALNEMRTIKKEHIYSDMRKILANFMGSPILRLMKDNCEKLEMDPEIFDLVYNGFWDLYSFHPEIRDVSARKLQAWILKIKLSSGPDRTPPAVEGQEEEKAPEAEEGEEGEAA